MKISIGTQKLVALVLGLLVLLPSSAEEEKKKLYRWVDNQGNVHYSDEPRKGAVEVKLKELTTIKMEKPKPLKLNLPQNKDKTEFLYKSFKISSPEDNGVIRNNGGFIELSATPDPELRQGHQVRFFLDGRPVIEEVNGLSVKMEGQAYGEHTASAIIVDGQGKQVIASKQIKFSLLNFINPKNRKNN
ncbi:DUF4124 domain-containing protein [Aliikangiella sp. G2MR2-5]|uniref:DUF4124 domain-containing protein n=1 Tax=Aliikangiella sp. G2MR2-5 TaxID=2788943 RepID=UPI0018A98B90|nr:DUF4124 domain-containing protein [Aliikangiella sp. G2MR2-5]